MAQSGRGWSDPVSFCWSALMMVLICNRQGFCCIPWCPANGEVGVEWVPDNPPMQRMVESSVSQLTMEKCGIKFFCFATILLFCRHNSCSSTRVDVNRTLSPPSSLHSSPGNAYCAKPNPTNPQVYFSLSLRSGECMGATIQIIVDFSI